MAKASGIIIERGKLRVVPAREIMTLAKVQKIVGGYVTIITRFPGIAGALAVAANEDGQPMGLSPNVTVQWGDYLIPLVGPVVLFWERGDRWAGLVTRNVERVRLVDVPGEPLPVLQVRPIGGAWPAPPGRAPGLSQREWSHLYTGTFPTPQPPGALP